MFPFIVRWTPCLPSGRQREITATESDDHRVTDAIINFKPSSNICSSSFLFLFPLPSFSIRYDFSFVCVKEIRVTEVRHRPRGPQAATLEFIGSTPHDDGECGNKSAMPLLRVHRDFFHSVLPSFMPFATPAQLDVFSVCRAHATLNAVSWVCRLVGWTVGDVFVLRRPLPSAQSQ